MANKPWTTKPKIVPYVISTVILAVFLSGLVIVATQFKISPPRTAVSTTNESNPPTQNQPVPSSFYTQQVNSEIDKMSTLSAQIKDADSWVSIDLPKLNLVIDFSK